MNLMGFEVGGLRLPLCEMENKNEDLLKAVLKDNKLM
jgi:4-hydroxy-tetrahydrodipicolinate synthase